MYDFRLNTDSELVRSAYESPNNRKWTLRPDEEFCPNPFVTYIEVWFGDTYMGCFTFHDTERVDTVQIHTTLLPCAFGQASAIGDELIWWLSGQDTYRILRTIADPSNRPIMRLIRSVGFEQVGQEKIIYNNSSQWFDRFELSIPMRSEQMSSTQNGGAECQQS
jgi:RimJ/RimL family protein N-acetyltransferase